MACELTRGRLVDCKDQIGGLKTIFFCAGYSSNIRQHYTPNGTDALQIDTCGFTGWSAYGSPTASTMTLFKYDLRPNLSSMTINTNSDPATGTTFFEQTLSLSLQKLTVAETNELKLICYNRVQIFVQDMNDNVFLLGFDNGVDVSGGTIVTGAAKGDMSGYTIELRAEEKDPMFFIKKTNGSGTDYPFDQLGDADSELTIVSGT
jgi:hypothetical protein|tara:strand:+ start:153 stop:767 length:615 start_codon:yes stop_codon:yes gene_type:complete